MWHGCGLIPSACLSCSHCLGKGSGDQVCSAAPAAEQVYLQAHMKVAQHILFAALLQESLMHVWLPAEYAEAVDLRHDRQGALYAQGAGLQQVCPLAGVNRQHSLPQPAVRAVPQPLHRPGQIRALHLLRPLPGEHIAVPLAPQCVMKKHSNDAAREAEEQSLFARRGPAEVIALLGDQLKSINLM